MTALIGAPGSIDVSVDGLRALVDTIEQIDVRLDSASGTQASGKRAILNSLVKQNESTINTVVEQIVSAFSQFDEATLAGVFTGLNKALDEKYSKQVGEYAEREAEARKNGESDVTLTPEQVQTLSDERKSLVATYTAVKNLLALSGQDVSEVPEPAKRQGARGPRGKRAISQVVWSIDGTELPADQQTGSAVAKALDFESAKAFREALTAAGVDVKNPPARIEVTLNGKQVVGVRGEAENASDEDDSDDDDE